MKQQKACGDGGKNGSNSVGQTPKPSLHPWVWFDWLPSHRMSQGGESSMSVNAGGGGGGEGVGRNQRQKERHCKCVNVYCAVCIFYIHNKCKQILDHVLSSLSVQQWEFLM